MSECSRCGRVPLQCACDNGSAYPFPLSNPCAHSDRRWDKRLLALAGHVAEWSKDPSTRVGAVLADDYHRVLAVGYNGFPRGVRDDGERYQDRAVKYKLVVHAEANAVLNALGTAEGSTLYATMYPCSECAKLIAQSGVARVVTWRPGTNASDASSHWSDDRAFSDTILRESGVEVVTYLTGEL